MTRCAYCHREGSGAFVQVAARTLDGAPSTLTFCRAVKACQHRAAKVYGTRDVQRPRVKVLT